MLKNQQKNILNSIISALPDNRPITALQIVEEFERCPKNFQPIHKTYDQDQDADLWRENLLFGKRSCRYLCQSKTEGLQDYILETLKVIGDKECAPEGYSILTRTADSEQKAWRKKQLAYRLIKKGAAKQAITDIILCSKFKTAPEGFTLAGEINGILVCFKTSPLIHRPPPSVPSKQSITDLEKTIENLKLQNNKPLYPVPLSENTSDHDYEQLRPSYQISSPSRPAPKPPVTSTGTLNIQTELDGVPFIINPNLKTDSFVMPQIFTSTAIQLEYDFQLERQVLCTTKSRNSQLKNPFFH